jgi:hypothetical protein
MTDSCDHVWQDRLALVQNPDGSTSTVKDGRECTKCGKVER